MPPFSDIVRDSKLETVFGEGYTEHVYYVSGDNPRQRKMRKEERWERRSSLGAGSYGTVWLEKLMTTDDGVGEYRAVKAARKTLHLSAATDYCRELEAIAKFSHQKQNNTKMCFVRSFGWYENHDSVFIAMEYFPLGDLQNHLSPPLLEKDVQQITSQVLEGLLFMHENGFAHRDLKPTNILAKSKGPDWWVKFGDLGISKRTEEGITVFRTVSGTYGFLAPEILAKAGILDNSASEVGNEYTVAVDIWSLGEIVFRAMTGKQLFPLRSLRAYVMGTMSFPIETLQAHGISERGCGFLQNLMAPKPTDRPTARDALSHVWINFQHHTSAGPSAQTQRSSSMVEEAIHPPEHVITEASASWSTATTATPKTTLALCDRRSALYAQGRPWLGRLSDVEAVAFSLDGRLVATVSGDSTIRLCDATTGVVRRVFDVMWKELQVLAISPDGKLAVGSNHGGALIWDCATGDKYRQFNQVQSKINDMAFSPDGRLLAVAHENSTVVLSDCVTGIPRVDLKGHSAAATAVAFSPNGKQVATGSNDTSIRLWDALMWGIGEN